MGQAKSIQTDSCFSDQCAAYLELCKPRVVALMVFTAWVGMLLARPGVWPWNALIFGSIGIALMAASAAAINHVVDRKVDAQMLRTKNRPLPTGNLPVSRCLVFALALGAAGLLVLIWRVNLLTAGLTFLSLIGYAIIYTLYLKRATPQNIVIGGAAGAAPPLLGWTAVTGQVDPYALVLFLIVFTWTPPHFWALAIYRKEDYARVGIPMLPVTHGDAYTRGQIIAYTVLLIIVTMLPFLMGVNGVVYLIGALLLGGGFLYHAIMLWYTSSPQWAIKTFVFSIVYLLILFTFLLIDRYLPILLARIPVL
ncbi:MAG TPA: protoheme IX farnesyltransferase [Chromatiales bacterium]|nr:protoheme IX farnesyltransferase [Thiotrichales bacterium]HIP68799.1 protoheme IX farnesyltransferase [Chromatiales bacterium]